MQPLSTHLAVFVDTGPQDVASQTDKSLRRDRRRRSILVPGLRRGRTPKMRKCSGHVSHHAGCSASRDLRPHSRQPAAAD
eukprot:1858277-Pleurochrysis_carterae.AAC.1